MCGTEYLCTDCGVYGDDQRCLLERAIQRVRDLHKAGRCDCGAENCDPEGICQYCGQVYPCETIEALDGVA